MQRSRGKLTSRIELPLPRDVVFAFFSDATNLAAITPREMGFRIRTPMPVTMRDGTVLDYTIHLWGIPVRWRSLIARWDPPHSFVDEQLRGPYKSWVHTHRFIAVGEHTIIEDEVVYTLRFGWIGVLAAPIVRRQLDRIFAFRAVKVRELLLAEGVPTLEDPA